MTLQQQGKEIHELKEEVAELRTQFNHMDKTLAVVISTLTIVRNALFGLIVLIVTGFMTAVGAFVYGRMSP